MNNKNKILVGCLALLLVLSVGYALFSQTVTINGTATAKGDFKITTTALTDSEIKAEGLGFANKGIVTDSNINITDNVVTTNVTFGMPGSYKLFVIKVENTGSVPAVLKSVTDENENAYDEGVRGFFAGKMVEDENKTSTIIVDMAPDLNYGVDYDSDGDLLGPDSLTTVDDVSSVILDPGESTYYYIDYSWDKSSTSGKEMSLSWTVKLNWEQVTSN